MQLKNASKYFSGLVASLSHIWVTKYQFDTAFTVWVCAKAFSTLFSYFWDLRVDWGLLRCHEISKLGLRHKLTYSKVFYYWAIVSNLALRFFWLIFIFCPLVVWDD